MKIPDPVAKIGERVDVENYRSRLAPLERGRVVGMAYENNFGGGFSWSYRVRLERESRTGRPIFLHVGDDKIETGR